METDAIETGLEQQLEEAAANLHYHLFAAKDQMDALEKIIKDYDAEEYAPNALAEMYVARELTRKLEALRDTYNNRGML